MKKSAQKNDRARARREQTRVERRATRHRVAREFMGGRRFKRELKVLTSDGLNKPSAGKLTREGNRLLRHAGFDPIYRPAP